MQRLTLAICVFLLSLQALAQNVQSFIALADTHVNAAKTTDITYGEDTGLRLWKSCLNELKTLIYNKKPKFILLLGDLPKHNDLKNLRTNIATVLNSISNLKAISNAKIPVFYAYGNNDSLVENYGAYFNGKRNLFYLDKKHSSPALKGWPTLNVNPDCSKSPKAACSFTTTTPMSKEHAKDMAYASKGYGYYSAYPLGFAVPLRLISLNTVLFSRNSAIKGNTQAEASQKQIDWLTDQLASASKNSEAVYIIMHIPPGTDAFFFAGDRWNDRLILKNGKTLRNTFLALMQKYKSTVRAVITAHTHMNELRALYSDKHMKTMNVLNVGVPGLTPNHYNNPGLQSYSYNRDFQLIDATTFYTTPAPSGWKSFSFQSDYKCPKSSTIFSCMATKILPKLNAWKLEPQPIPSNTYELNYSLRNHRYNPSPYSSWLGILNAIQVAPS